MSESFRHHLEESFSESEQLEISSLIHSIDGLRSQTDNLSPENLQAGLARLSPARLRSSGSLRRGDLESWVKANSYVSEKITADISPNAADILNVNSLLLAGVPGKLRSDDIWVGPHKAADPAELQNLFEHFCQNILPANNHEHPLIAAGLARFWLVSLHPFDDANGRTSVMIADWILLLSGYLPMAFESAVDGIVASWNKHRASATAGTAVIKSLRSVEYSYKLMLGMSS